MCIYLYVLFAWCIGVCKCVFMCVGMCTCVFYKYRCWCMCVYVCLCVCVVYVCVCMIACRSDSDLIVWSEPGNREQQLRSLWTRYARKFEDRPTSRFEDLHRFVQEDPMVIRIRNHVISCECLLLHYYYLLLLVNVLSVIICGHLFVLLQWYWFSIVII